MEVIIVDLQFDISLLLNETKGKISLKENAFVHHIED